MRTKNPANEQIQRDRLLRAAWELFRTKGYSNTTMEDILAAAECSKGRFYYYYKSKAELLDLLYTVFDEKYREVYAALDPALSTAEKFLAIDSFLFRFMEEEIGCELLSQLFISQLNHTTGIDFWNIDRKYPRILREMAEEGQRRGELRSDVTAEQIASAAEGVERSILLNWCVTGGRFSLGSAGPSSFSAFFRVFEAQQ